MKAPSPSAFAAARCGLAVARSPALLVKGQYCSEAQTEGDQFLKTCIIQFLQIALQRREASEIEINRHRAPYRYRFHRSLEGMNSNVSSLGIFQRHLA
jgi:hypothetical protein